MMFWIALIQATPSVAPRDAAQATTDVVVTASRLDDAKRALDDCLARRCPPKEDIELSLRYAQGQFVAGDYIGSRRTMLGARHRNAHFAGSIPLEVSTVDRAVGRMYGLTGLVDPERLALIDMVNALKAGLSGGDERIVAARLELGDALARSGKLDEAIDCYNAVAKQARRMGLRTVQGMAMFRRAALLAAVASNRSLYRTSAQNAVRDIRSTNDAALAPFRNAALLIDAQLIDNGYKRAQAIDRAVARMEPISTDTPLLLYSPQVDLEGRFGAATGNTDTQWFDVTFLVGADGKVNDIETRRQSSAVDPIWIKRTTDAIARRRYMPMVASNDASGLHRVERYSFVSDLELDTGSRIQSRRSRRRIVMTDLTSDNAWLAPSMTDSSAGIQRSMEGNVGNRQAMTCRSTC